MTLSLHTLCQAFNNLLCFPFYIFILFHSIVEKANVCFVETVRETKAITLEFRLNEHHFSGNNNITSDTTFRVNWPDLLPWHLAHWLVLTLHYIDVTLQNRAMLLFFPKTKPPRDFISQSKVLMFQSGRTTLDQSAWFSHHVAHFTPFHPQFFCSLSKRMQELV